MADAIFSSTQQRLFALLFGQTPRSFSISELIDLAKAGSGAIQRELRRLTDSGLVSVVTEAGRKRYRANEQAAIFDELRGLVDKTVGIGAQLRAALSVLGDRVALAILFGSVAKGSATAVSDVDLLVVSDDLTLEDLFAQLAPVEERLARKVSPVLYTRAEFRRRRESAHPFLTKVLAGAHMVLVGDEHAIAPTGQSGSDRKPQAGAS